MAGWGTMPWGLGSWGLSFASALADLSISGAVAQTTNSVRVALTAPALASSPTVAGGALNPATWSVTRLDTGDGFTVLAVTQVASDVYDVHVLEDFAPFFVLHRVESTTLRRVDGAVVVPPTSADFQGLASASTATLAALAASRLLSPVDVANPPTPRSPSVGGTLVITSGGDYESVSGAELVRKLIIRRIVTNVGDFFHLPNYGIGINVKEPLPSNDLVKLQTDIERQALLEPEVEEVRVGLTLTPNNILTITVKARLRQTGEVLAFPFEFPSPVVAL